MGEEEIEETKRDPAKLKIYLRDYFSKLNPNASDAEIEEFVETNVSEYATGGRVGYASGFGVTDYAKSMNSGRGPITLNDFIDIYKFAGYDDGTASSLGKKHYKTGMGQDSNTQGFAMGGEVPVRKTRVE